MRKGIDMKSYIGVPASGGISTSTIIKLNENTNYLDIEDNLILLVHSSSPEWVLPLRKAAGIICEIGGNYSHLAILCREMNKPCITGVENIYSLLFDGEKVMINGFTGEIYVYG